jgi:hypothetical protein
MASVEKGGMAAEEMQGAMSSRMNVFVVIEDMIEAVEASKVFSTCRNDRP